MIQCINCINSLHQNYSTTQILGNVQIDQDNTKGRKYFEGSLKFQATLTVILKKLVRRTKMLAADDISGANISQIWGIILLIFVMILSPILVILAKNAISSIQVFAVSVEKKSADMKKQKRKQDALIFKMLPKDVVEKLNSGADTAENFESATLFFSTVVDFATVTKGEKGSFLFCITNLNTMYIILQCVKQWKLSISLMICIVPWMSVWISMMFIKLRPFLTLTLWHLDYQAAMVTSKP